MNTDKCNYAGRLIVTSLLALLLSVSAITGQKVYKVSVDVNPHYIRANQPFSMVFSAKSTPFAPGEEKMRALRPDTTDFVIIGKVNAFSSLVNISGTSVCNNRYVYTLVPRRSGDLLIRGVTIAYNDSAIFRYDSIRIHVYDGRISSEDSLEKLKGARRVLSSNQDVTKAAYRQLDANNMFNFFPKPNVRGPDGIHFNYADSVYHAKKDQPFDVVYSLSLVNVQGTSRATLADISVSNISCPKNVELKADRPDTYANSNVGGKEPYSEYAKLHIFRLIAHKKGNYKIPPLAFIYKGEKYMSPEVKVVVSE